MKRERRRCVHITHKSQLSPTYTGFADDLLDDNLPRTILNYANGQSFEEHFEVIDDKVSRVDLEKLFGGKTGLVINSSMLIKKFDVSNRGR